MTDIRKGDTVRIISGKEKGKSGKVLDVLREKGRVRIERHQLVKRHLKKGRNQSNPQGGIVEREGTVAISSVMVLQGDAPVRREKIVRQLGAKEKARQEKRKAAR
jgi:large subunit ribosomal protein L24